MNFNKEIIVNDKLSIGGNNQTFIIAEACDNHMGRMDYALKMVDIAVLCGADAIKFQHHLPDEEMLPDVPMSDNFKEPLYEILKKFSLTLDQHKELKNYCEQKGILYMCTPFSLKAATEIEDFVDLYKIGSGECTDTPTLIEIAKKGKPMIISTGMASIDEIEYTLQTLHPYNKNIMIMNCTSEYPPNYEDINVKLIPKLSEKFNIIVGHSDHTPDNYTCFAAVSHGAKLIEKHIILDKSYPGPDQNVSIDPLGLHDLVDGIRKVEKSLGENKEIHNLEKPIKEWARRSIVTIKDINQGEEFTLENLWTKRPGTGIPARELFNILGKKARNNIDINKLLLESNIIS
jgi:N,N'-diacetyllegionaminate synthase